MTEANKKGPDYSHWRRHGVVGRIIHYRVADMRNDIELTREILFAIRDNDNLRPSPVQIQGYEPVLVARHVKRLLDDGMIEGRVSQTIGMEAPLVFVVDMTTEGHNFLAVLEQKDIWSRLTKALSPGEIAAFSTREIAGLAKDLALKIAKKKLGLDD